MTPNPKTTKGATVTITSEKVAKLLETVDAGLVSGIEADRAQRSVKLQSELHPDPIRHRNDKYFVVSWALSVDGKPIMTADVKAEMD